MKTRASGRLSPLPLAGQLVPARGIGLGVPPVPDVSAPYLSIRMMIAENGSVRFSNQSHQMPNRMVSTVPLIRSMAQGCRLGRCSKSAAIWGTPDVLLTWSQGQPLTHKRHGCDRIRSRDEHCAAADPELLSEPVLAFQHYASAPPGPCRFKSELRLRSPTLSIGCFGRTALPSSSRGPWIHD